MQCTSQPKGGFTNRAVGRCRLRRYRFRRIAPQESAPISQGQVRRPEHGNMRRSAPFPAAEEHEQKRGVGQGEEPGRHFSSPSLTFATFSLSLEACCSARRAAVGEGAADMMELKSRRQAARGSGLDVGQCPVAVSAMPAPANHHGTHVPLHLSQQHACAHMRHNSHYPS